MTQIRRRVEGGQQKAQRCCSGKETFPFPFHSDQYNGKWKASFRLVGVTRRTFAISCCVCVKVFGKNFAVAKDLETIRGANKHPNTNTYIKGGVPRRLASKLIENAFQRRRGKEGSGNSIGLYGIVGQTKVIKSATLRVLRVTKVYLWIRLAS